MCLGKKSATLSSIIVYCCCCSGGELQLSSVAEVAVNKTKPLQGSCMSMSSEELRLAASTLFRFTSPCYLNQYYRIPKDCQSGFCSLLNSRNVIHFFPNGIHPRVMIDLAIELTKPVLLIYQQFWLIEEVPLDWKLTNIILVYEKGWKDGLGDNQPDLSTRKVMEQIFLSTTIQHRQGSGQANIRLQKAGPAWQCDLLLWQSDQLCWWGKGCGCCLSTFSIKCLTPSPTALPGEAGSPWLTQGHPLLD